MSLTHFTRRPPAQIETRRQKKKAEKNSASRQGRVRQLAMRVSLGSVIPDHERVSWSLYKREVPPHKAWLQL